MRATAKGVDSCSLTTVLETSRTFTDDDDNDDDDDDDGDYDDDNDVDDDDDHHDDDRCFSHITVLQHILVTSNKKYQNYQISNIRPYSGFMFLEKQLRIPGCLY